MMADLDSGNNQNMCSYDCCIWLCQGVEVEINIK